MPFGGSLDPCSPRLHSGDDGGAGAVMRGSRRDGRRRGLAIGAVVAAGLLAAACTAGVPGRPTGAEIRPATAGRTVSQALLDLGEAGAVRYRGTMAAASGEPLGFDLTAAQTGEILGSVTLDGQSAALLVLNDTTYLKAGAPFWAAVSALEGGQGKGTAVADRWVRTPAPLIGVEFGAVFAPDVLGRQLTQGVDKVGDLPFGEGERVAVGAGQAVKFTTDGGTVYVGDRAPHGVVKVEARRVGTSDTTSVEGLVAEVGDVTAGLAAFYQELARQAEQVGTPVDVLTTVREDGHEFQGCGAASCSIVVRFTNTSKAAVKVGVRGTWQGDGAPLGICDAQAGPVAPGQAASATCTLSSPEWVAFYRRANSVPGNHPYSVEWSTLVLAEAPDLTRIKARAAATPADAGAPRREGSHFVYALGYTDGGQRVWKYGVVAGEFWRDHAAQQIGACVASAKALCHVDLVTAADSAAGGYGLVGKLVQEHRARAGACPGGQWVGCGA